MNIPRIRQVKVRNYKSIAACDVRLQDLTFLVGPNAAGKSNFLDALRFTSEALSTSLDHALRERGTIQEVRRRSGGHPDHFAIRLDFDLQNDLTGHYSFSVAAKPAGRFEVQSEECAVASSTSQDKKAIFSVRSGTIVSSTIDRLPASLPDRLFLVACSGLPEFRPVYDALTSMQVYNLNPHSIAAMQKPDSVTMLRRDGSNAASVQQRLTEEAREHIQRYLSQIAEGVSDVEATTFGNLESVQFLQRVKGQQHPWRFMASSMSDGTLRAYGVLLAIFQSIDTAQPIETPLLIGLEEPETALHPAATSILLAALREASRHVQIVVTSHSPDLLDVADIPIESLLSVVSDEGRSKIGPVDMAGREILRKQLFTPGELMRQNQLTIDDDALADVHNETQLQLFEYGG